MEYLSLNLLTISLIVPLHSMVYQEFDNVSVAISFSKCISSIDIHHHKKGVGDLCYDNTQTFEIDEPNKEFIKSFVDNIKKN